MATRKPTSKQSRPGQLATLGTILALLLAPGCGGGGSTGAHSSTIPTTPAAISSTPSASGATGSSHSATPTPTSSSANATQPAASVASVFERVSSPGRAGDWMHISGDGQFVMYVSGDIHVVDRAQGRSQIVPVPLRLNTGNDFYSGAGTVMSTDGSCIAFQSLNDQVVVGDTNGLLDVFVYDQSAGYAERVSVSSAGTEGNDKSASPAISATGRFVAFQSGATNLVPNDTNGAYDIFCRDRDRGTTERVSLGSQGQAADGRSYLPSISDDGRYVTFFCEATNLVQGVRGSQLYVHDRQTGQTELISRSPSGRAASSTSYNASVTPDGRFVCFSSDASNLVANDNNNQRDIFVCDRSTQTMHLVSLDENGAQIALGSRAPAISADGRFVVFYPRDNSWSLIVHDRQTGISARRALPNAQPNSTPLGIMGATSPDISADGRFVVFSAADHEIPISPGSRTMVWVTSVFVIGNPLLP